MTGIEWTDETWNPTTGCDRVSPGCDHCYALTMARRLKGIGQAKYQRDGDQKTSGPGFGVSVHPDELTAPLRWRRPRRVFVDSMGDLFHDQVPDEFIARVWAVMAATPQHTYQVLTKRHGRMRSLLGSDGFDHLALDLSHEMKPVPIGSLPHGDTYPLPNVWGGVSVENQAAADLRIPKLVETPLAVRFLSCEPLLGQIDLSMVTTRNGTLPVAPLEVHYDQDTGVGRRPISWVIAGGESGAGARPMHPDWARSLRDQCQAAGVPFFFKQWGSWAPGDPRRWHSQAAWVPVDEPAYSSLEHRRSGSDAYMYAPKSKSLRELDGRTWDEFPMVAQ
jgi:protein gp37